MMSPPLIVVIREPGRIPLHLLVKESIEVGRDCAGLVLTDPQMSRLHLELRPERGRVIVTDLESTNGTTIDGRELDAPTPLGVSSTVTVGATTIRLLSDVSSTMLPGETAAAFTAEMRRTSIDIVADAVARSVPDISSVGVQHGTVTIVFSDIESSTERAEVLGDEKWFELLSAHNAIVRARVASHGGTEIKAQGDGFMLVFSSARDAVMAMSAVQRDLTEHSAQHPSQQVRIRIGIHTGEAITGDDGDLFGKHVNLAARVANEAKGGEILVSSLVREIIESRGDINFGEAKVAGLKGFTGTYTMFPIVWS